jgi:hypothetical protein
VSEPTAPADVTTVVTAEPPPSESGEPARERPTRPSAARHAPRFQFFSGALVFLAVASLALAFVFVATSTDKPVSESGTWSVFKPSSDNLDSAATEIADYVAGQYRLPSGAQIVAVTGGTKIQDIPVKIAFRESVADGGTAKILDGKSVLYHMCGLGPKCAIAEGKATKERGLLLRREALELALYSFHYLKNIEHVVVFIPPPKGEDPSVAVHFGRGDVAGQLARPLKMTLPTPVPNPDTISTAPNTSAVQQLTLTNLFKSSLTSGNQDANVYVVLEPLTSDS